MIRKIFTILTCLTFIIVGQAQAISPQQQQALDTDTEFYLGTGQLTTSSCPGSGGSTTPTSPIATTQTENQNAETIIGIAKTDNIGEAGALIGILVSIDESSLTDLANTNVPLSLSNPQAQGTGSNGNSLGIFQQQVGDDWTTLTPDDISNTAVINQLMTPAYAAEAFFGGGTGSGPGALSKGLINQAGWQALQPWVVAQDIQASAWNGIPSAGNDYSSVYGGNYENILNEAGNPVQTFLSEYWNTAPAIPLPVPLDTTATPDTGSGASTSPCSSSCTTNSSTGQIGQTVVCIAEQELALWQTYNIVEGTTITSQYFEKYSQGRDEDWCADFASWVYDQAGDPMTTAAGGNISYVPNIQDLGSNDPSSFAWHPIGPGDPAYTPQPGDLAIHGSQHVNIVIAVNGSQVTLIGGDQTVSETDHDLNIVSEYTTDINGDSPPITGFISPVN